MVMQKQLNGDTVTVPVPTHRELQSGTLASIIRQSGLARSLFEVGGERRWEPAHGGLSILEGGFQA